MLKNKEKLFEASQSIKILTSEIILELNHVHWNDDGFKNKKLKTDIDELERNLVIIKTFNNLA